MISHLYLLLLYICKIEGLLSDFPSNSDVLLDCEPLKTKKTKKTLNVVYHDFNVEIILPLAEGNSSVSSNHLCSLKFNLIVQSPIKAGKQQMLLEA